MNTTRSPYSAKALLFAAAYIILSGHLKRRRFYFRNCLGSLLYLLPSKKGSQRRPNVPRPRLATKEENNTAGCRRLWGQRRCCLHERAPTAWRKKGAGIKGWTGGGGSVNPNPARQCQGTCRRRPSPSVHLNAFLAARQN